MNIFRRKYRVLVTHLALVNDGQAATVQVDFKIPNGDEISLPLSFRSLQKFADDIDCFAPRDEIIISKHIFTGTWKLEGNAKTIVGGVSQLVAGIWHEAFCSNIRYLKRCYHDIRNAGTDSQQIHHYKLRLIVARNAVKVFLK